MTTQQVAEKLRTAVLAFDLESIHRDLFASDIQSIEPGFAPMPHARGIAEVQQKAQLFGGALKELHTRTVSDTLEVSGDHFSMGMSFDATLHDHSRMQISEIIVYQVKDGKIVLEQFFY